MVVSPRRTLLTPSSYMLSIPLDLAEDSICVSGASGMRVLQTASETLTTRYFHTDNLGSISVITDESGTVQERLAYDAWGKRRNANGTDDPTDSITSQTTRGFTGQEELSVFGLVHLNGRVYDPFLARFTSADTITESPYSTQGWNRYSYVGNDPLAYTDPSGHCFLGCVFSWIGHEVSSAFHAVTHFFQTNAIARAILQIGSTFALNVLLPGLGFAGAALAATSAAGGAIIATGLSGGNLTQTFKAGLIAGVTAFAFYEVGSATNAIAGENPYGEHIQPQFGTPAYAFNVAGHAAVGCLSSVASGGQCGSGALSGGITAGAGPLINNQNFAVAVAENAVIGGAASVAGGGKFANGAVTGAFGYMFNACGADPHGCLKMGIATGTVSGLYSAAAISGGSLGVLTPIGLGIAGLDILIGGTIGEISDIIGNGIYI